MEKGIGNIDSRALRSEHLLIVQIGSSYTYAVYVVPEKYKEIETYELFTDKNQDKIIEILTQKNGVAQIHSEGAVNRLILTNVDEYQWEVVSELTQRAKELGIHLALELF